MTDKLLVRKLQENLNEVSTPELTDVEQYIHIRTFEKHRARKYGSMTILIVLLLGGAVFISHQVKNIKAKVSATSELPLKQQQILKTHAPTQSVVVNKERDNAIQRNSPHGHALTVSNQKTVQVDSYSDIIDLNLSDYNQKDLMLSTPIQIEDFNAIDQSLLN